MRRGRPIDAECPMGKGIVFGARRRAVATLPPGDCDNCGDGPLHGPSVAGGHCGCSFVRCGRRVCRTCAIGIDLLLHGGTKIDDAGIAAHDNVSLIQRVYRWVAVHD